MFSLQLCDLVNSCSLRSKIQLHITVSFSWLLICLFNHTCSVGTCTPFSSWQGEHRGGRDIDQYHWNKTSLTTTRSYLDVHWLIVEFSIASCELIVAKCKDGIIHDFYWRQVARDNLWSPAKPSRFFHPQEMSKVGFSRQGVPGLFFKPGPQTPH